MKKLILALMFSMSMLFAFEELTVQNYESKIANKNVILDFYAVW